MAVLLYGVDKALIKAKEDYSNKGERNFE